MIDIRMVPDKDALGAQAAALGATAIREAQGRHGHANIIVATGASQFEVLTHLVAAKRIDVCFAGIGENCHLAFNDPPADFDTEQPYIVVTLDEACRNQQFGEGWFPTFDAVPERAISMSVRQIMKSELIILSVPDARKAQAVRDALEGPVSNLHPASILQSHKRTVLFLDPPAASLLTKR
jgi:glucosamine-6-phosphate deaminase